MSNPILSGHDLCFDRMGQWGLASKHEMRGVKTVQNIEGSSLTFHRKKLSVKDTILIFIHPAFATKGCVHCEKPDTNLLWRKANVLYSWNLPCNVEDNLHDEHIVIEDWFRGYCGSPGLGGPRASSLLDMGRTDGPSRYKIEDYLSCPGDSRMRGWQV